MSPEVDASDAEQAKREGENRLLKIGYFGLMQERYPFQPTNKPSYNDENAYFLSLERKYMDIPVELEFPNLIANIPKKHHQRLQRIWEKVEESYFEFLGISSDLQTKWKNSPAPGTDPETTAIMERSAIKIATALQPGGQAIIARAIQGSDLKKWQREEKGLRGQFYAETKILLVSLRLYYEMLLETSHESEDITQEKEYVLPKDHPQRNEIAIRNRFLRLIDATHQGIAIGKAAHHQQRKPRIRKKEVKPYIVHGMDVTFASILDTIPYILEHGQTELAVILGIVGPIHDLVEDTNLDIDTLISNYLNRLTDFYDSSLDPIIESGFPDYTREYIKQKVLNLLKNKTAKAIRQLLRILSNNTVLTPKEKRTAAKNNIAPTQRILDNLEINDQDRNNWGIELKEPNSETYQQFPVEPTDDNKATNFLLRLTTLVGQVKQQAALILKLEDRSNYNITSKDMPAENRRNTMRANTSRIIAWAMLDHNNSQYPLSNSLPRTIDTTLQVYKEIQVNTPELIEELDKQYIAQLEQWQTDVLRFELPQKIKALFEREAQLKAT